MLNELLWIGLTLIIFSIVLLAYKFFGKAGLYAWMAVAIILANIQVTKMITIFGMVTAMGNIIYGTTFLTTDILNEKYGAKEARKGVWIGFFMLIATTIMMQITLKFSPHASDIADPALQTIFGILPRIAFASLLAYGVSQAHDVWLYASMKRNLKGKKLWLRNNLSTLASQLLDNMVFTLVAFWGVFPWSIILQIFVTSYILKFGVALLDTPFLYLARKMKVPDDK
ncbi:MAG: queuosine precursor transporter [archaeon]